MYEHIFYIIICVFIFMSGASVGSFSNVLIYRMPRGENFVFGRSRCPACRQNIKSVDLIPIFSWIFLRGKCRSCEKRISVKYPLIELFTALLYLTAFLVLGFNFRFFIALILFPVLIIMSAMDFIKMEIPYWCSITIAALGLVAFGFSFKEPLQSVWYEHIIGLFIISVPFAVFAYLGAMGGGDVQLVAAAGLLLGWSIVPAVLIAFLVGAVFAVIMRITKKLDRVCFGPFLAVGIGISYLYGHKIIESYLQLIKIM